MADNPFHYGRIATAEFFTDRLAETRSLVSDAASGQNVVIISPRRFGKTSLALRARDQLTQHKVPVAYADLFRAIHAHGVIGVNRQPTPPGGGVDQDAAEEQARDELERTRVGSAAHVRSQHEVVAAHQHDYRKEAVRELTTQTRPAMPAHPGANCALV